MPNYQLNITDEKTGAAIGGATLNDSDIVTDSTGNCVFNDSRANFDATVMKTGYTPFTLTLQPGPNNVKLSPIATGNTNSSTTATTGSFYERNKTMIIIIGLLILVYLAYKYGWLNPLTSAA